MLPGFQMAWFYNLKTGLKLALAFGIVLTLMLIGNFLSLQSLKVLEEDTKQLYSDSTQVMVIVGNMNEEVLGYHREEKNLILHLDEADLARRRSNLEKYRGQLMAELDRLRPLIYSEKGKQFMADFEQKWADFEVVSKKVVALGEQGKRMEAQTEAAAGRKIVDALEGTIDEFSEFKENQAEEFMKEAQTTAAAAQQRLFMVSAISLIFSIFIAAITGRYFAGQLTALQSKLGSLDQLDITNLRSGMEALAEGDLTQTVKTGTAPLQNDYRDEVGAIVQSFNSVLKQMQDTVGAYENARANLTALIQDVARTSKTVTHTSNELAASADTVKTSVGDITRAIGEVATTSTESARSSQEMANGSEQLASSATAASNATEKLSSAISEVEEAGQRQKSLTVDAVSKAHEGNESVDATMQAMTRVQTQVEASTAVVRDLGEKGQQIGAIVQTIEEIASQTNLLALNAAIEAARAGEQGRGFAVVADEVRKLAERSAEATQEIAQLIESVRSGVNDAIQAMEASNEEVAQGAEKSAATQKALDEIVTAIDSVQKEVSATDKSIKLMTESATQVQNAIASVAAVSEESAAGAQEMSAMSEEVSASAQEVLQGARRQEQTIQEINASAQDLRGMAAQLDELLSNFRFDSSEPIRTEETSYRRAA
jgi:methyl-accepting chemotaxis protein